MLNPVIGIGRSLLLLGLVFLVLGGLFLLGGRFLGWGRLPGDIFIQGKHFQFYFPLVTCLLISVAATLLLYLARAFLGK